MRFIYFFASFLSSMIAKCCGMFYLTQLSKMGCMNKLMVNFFCNTVLPAWCKTVVIFNVWTPPSQKNVMCPKNCLVICVHFRVHILEDFYHFQTLHTNFLFLPPPSNIATKYLHTSRLDHGFIFIVFCLICFVLKSSFTPISCQFHCVTDLGRSVHSLWCFFCRHPMCAGSLKQAVIVYVCC